MLGQDAPDWKIKHKHVNLTKYDGNRRHYEMWATKVLEHLEANSHPCWNKLLTWVQRQPEPLTLEKLDSLSPWKVSLRVIAKELWAFLGQFAIEDSLYRTRDTDAEPYNGLELWRVYFDRARGISEVVQNQNFMNLLNFSQITNDRQLVSRIPEWKKLFAEHGSGIDANKKKALFIRILPNYLQRDIECRFT